MNQLEAYLNYKNAVDVSAKQLQDIRQIEAEKDAQTENGKLSRDGVKLLNRLDDLYMHRMNVIVPAVAEAKRKLWLTTVLECNVEMRIS